MRGGRGDRDAAGWGALHVSRATSGSRVPLSRLAPLATLPRRGGRVRVGSLHRWRTALDRTSYRSSRPCSVTTRSATSARSSPCRASPASSCSRSTC
ncbi:hypothetical protein EOE48_08320 [Methylobacterium oryzihabitans]|uniref:Uncharacterized protein n=1 Tax=Methylobacterium oryzihabitans TaxID=2499852 RepID=A0A3S2VRT8_9HYPH|nr:hypothetical protein EOE48_08320 [Methylobacterium oryzihabitans]